MSKSIKLENNNYIDSTGITHNRELLSTILNNATVYDSGTNTNGNYIRFKNGVMICWHSIVGSTHPNKTRYGNGFFYQQGAYSSTSPENAKTWNFPMTFISSPVVQVNVSSSAYTITSLGGVGTTWAGASCATPYEVDSVTFTWYFLAIGFWK